MNIAVLELEEKIRKIIAQDNGRATIFDYDADPPAGHQNDKPGYGVMLEVSTFNEATKEVTLMYRTTAGIKKEEALAQVLHYLEVIKPTLSPYTMVWKKKGEAGESNKSFFYVNNVQEILDKFFATRKIEEYVIFSITMKGYT